MDSGSAQTSPTTAPVATQPASLTPAGPTIGIASASKSSGKGLLLLIGAFLFVFLLGIGFEKYQIVAKIKKIPLPKIIIVMPTPTPTATGAAILTTPMPVPDTMNDWKTYTNEKYAYEVKCPQTSTHAVEVASGDGLTKPYFQEICSDSQNQLRIYVYPAAHTQMASDGAILKDFVSTSKKERIFLRGFSQSYFDQILSTFKLTEQKLSANTSYTCPSGNYINCIPSADGMVKKECSAAAFDWYKANCPNFKASN